MELSVCLSVSPSVGVCLLFQSAFLGHKIVQIELQIFFGTFWAKVTAKIAFRKNRLKGGPFRVRQRQVL